MTTTETNQLDTRVADLADMVGTLNDSSPTQVLKEALAQADALLDDTHLKRGYDEQDILLYSTVQSLRLRIQRIMGRVNARELALQHTRAAASSRTQP